MKFSNCTVTKYKTVLLFCSFQVLYCISQSLYCFSNSSSSLFTCSSRDSAITNHTTTSSAFHLQSVDCQHSKTQRTKHRQCYSALSLYITEKFQYISQPSKAKQQNFNFTAHKSTTYTFVCLRAVPEKNSRGHFFTPLHPQDKNCETPTPGQINCSGLPSLGQKIIMG